MIRLQDFITIHNCKITRWLKEKLLSIYSDEKGKHTFAWIQVVREEWGNPKNLVIENERGETQHNSDDDDDNDEYKNFGDGDKNSTDRD